MNHPLVVVAGVSGSGKSTVGFALAGRLGVDFIDGDALHPVANIAKMSSGMPLTDEDRAPWLAVVSETLRAHRECGLVVACSSLRRRYRDAIRSSEPAVVFITLSGSRSLLEERLGQRADHFMPVALLDSQLAAFEALQPDEAGTDLPISDPVDAIVDGAVRALDARADH